MILVTGCNQRYLGRIMPYLDTLRMYADFPVHLITVGFEADANHIRSLPLSREQNAGAPPETESIQHGSFLQVVKCKPEEVIIYTDGDFGMQHRMDDSEREYLDIKDNQVVIGYNFGPQSTLINDAHLLGAYRGVESLPLEWGEIVNTAQDWNAGFMAMNRRTWARLYRAYMLDWERVCGTFQHQARQQWLISYEIAALGLDVKICPWSIHAHGHGGLKPGMEHRSDGLYADGKLALFRHYL